MTYRGIGCPRAPVQLFRESIVALGPASFRPTSSVAKLSALGDDSPPDCLLAGIRQSPSSNPRAHTALADKEKLARLHKIYSFVVMEWPGRAQRPNLLD